MEHDEFIRMLAKEGFTEVVTVTRAADGFLESHSHSFEAKAFILQGEIHLYIGETTLICQPGNVFHLLANELHSERYGRDGVTYLVGRK